MVDTALVTGASGGIGEELARLLAAGGANVVLVARSADRLTSLADELSGTHGVQAHVIVQDLSAPDATDRIMDALAAAGLGIDILINNAGFATYGPFVQTPEDEEVRLLAVNVVTLTRLTKRLLPGMLARGKGRVLNVASTAAFQPGPLMAVYYASKAYVLSLSEALAEEARNTAVTITCLCPGPTETGFQARARMQESRLFETVGVTSPADVARAGYDAMMAGRAIVVPGLRNRVGVQLIRIAPRAAVRRVIRNIQDRR